MASRRQGSDTYPRFGHAGFSPATLRVFPVTLLGPYPTETDASQGASEGLGFGARAVNVTSLH
jgi:hypothetical protein